MKAALEPEVARKWVRAYVVSRCAGELAKVLAVSPDVSWSTLLTHVQIIVAQNATARKRAQRRKAGAKPRKAPL